MSGLTGEGAHTLHMTHTLRHESAHRDCLSIYSMYDLLYTFQRSHIMLIFSHLSGAVQCCSASIHPLSEHSILVPVSLMPLPRKSLV